MRAACCLAIAFAFASACWTGAAREPTPLDNMVVAPRARSQLPASSVWSGTYVCGQGVSAVTLTLRLSPEGDARAKFEFGPVAENPGVPVGSYWMKGSARTARTGVIELGLEPDRWIDQPDGYVMVSLLAVIDAHQRNLHGHIDNDRCEEITARRQR